MAWTCPGSGAATAAPGEMVMDGVFFGGKNMGKTWGKHGENGENNGTLCLFFGKMRKIMGETMKIDGSVGG